MKEDDDARIKRIENEVDQIKNAAEKSQNKSLLLTYVSAIELRLTQAIQKAFIAGDDSFLLSSKDSSSLDFAQKIELAYRMGLISPRMKEYLAALRKLRNSAAHDENDLDLDDGNISYRIDQLYLAFSEDTREAFPAQDAKEKLETVCAIMIIDLIHKRNAFEPAESMKEELPFSWVDNPPDDEPGSTKTKEPKKS